MRFPRRLVSGLLLLLLAIGAYGQAPPQPISFRVKLSRTVANQLQSIYGKLGIASRLELAAGAAGKRSRR